MDKVRKGAKIRVPKHQSMRASVELPDLQGRAATEVMKNGEGRTRNHGLAT